MDINLTDGQSHRVSTCALDWDLSGRSERVDVVDPSTGTVLDSRTIIPARKFRMLLHTNPTRERGECLGTRAGASEDM